MTADPTDPSGHDAPPHPALLALDELHRRRPSPRTIPVVAAVLASAPGTPSGRPVDTW